jgi:DNA-binding winged helix-turn-helix (wHTH) protein
MKGRSKEGKDWWIQHYETACRKKINKTQCVCNTLRNKGYRIIQDWEEINNKEQQDNETAVE